MRRNRSTAPVLTKASDPRFDPAARIGKGASLALRDHLRAEGWAGRQMDRAVQVDMAELFIADVEVHAIHAGAVHQMPMHVALTSGHAPTASTTRWSSPLSAGGLYASAN